MYNTVCSNNNIFGGGLIRKDYVDGCDYCGWHFGDDVWMDVIWLLCLLRSVNHSDGGWMWVCLCILYCMITDGREGGNGWVGITCVLCEC